MTTLFKAQRPVVVIGGAIGDIVLNLDQLPRSGGDTLAVETGRQVGGCGFNVARALRRLEVEVINGMTVGNGPWGEQIAAQMQALTLPVLLRDLNQDNGWCLALVEPNGERTFVTVTGCETQWHTTALDSLPLDAQAIVYANGYELVGDAGATLRQWLLDLPRQQCCFLDFGPRIVDLPSAFISALAGSNTTLSLNRQETALLCGEGEPVAQAQALAQRLQLNVLCRLDHEGAWCCQPGQPPQPVPAYPVQLVDTVGAGDAHCAGVLAGLAAGWSLMAAADLGNRVAACVVEQTGAAGAPDWDHLRRRFYPG
ncbi:PfkB family carbohydrate kinase [Pseudomonas sp. GL-RE-26]|uniref:PfkB family carbohydrate kinase n=1 Tax=Pseudomonas sp. GL-RE-26 TaxID=2832390 RepID=UPI001CBB1422|nr:PfkB family carbohydrate kinase [Pseudomonas sp. GL-RE-26]